MNRNVFFSFLLLFAFLTASFSQPEPISSDMNESVKIETIKTPFSILLDENLNQIRVKLLDGENIKLSAIKKDSNASLEIIAYKNGEIVEDKKVDRDFDGEFDFKDIDEIVLKSFGKFLIKATKLEIIADMEINIPEDTIISDENNKVAFEENEKENRDLNEEFNKGDTKIVEEVISAKDEEAFKKATGVSLVEADENETSIISNKENKIELSYDDTMQKREFDEKLKEEIEKEESFKELNKKPLNLEKEEKIIEIEKEPKAITPNLKELKDEEIKTSLKENIPKESLKPKDLDTHLPDLKKIEESEIKAVLKDDLKEKRVDIRKPKISKEILPKSFEDKNLKDIAKKSDLKQIISNDEIKKPSVKTIEKISKAFETTVYFQTPKIASKGVSINKPSIKNIDIDMSNKDKFQTKKPKISSLNDSALKPENVENIKAIANKPESLEIETPKIASNKEIVKKPDIKEAPSLVESEIDIGKKPDIKENISIKPPKISTKIETPKVTAAPILPLKKPDIKSKETFSKPSSLPSSLTGYLDVYVLKDGKPTIGWISVIDERTNKVVANGDTFYKNPATFKLPIGKYTIVILDKKVVPPLEEKIYSVEVKGGKRTVAKSTFASGTLKVAVLKNSIPTSTAYVKIYDAKTHEKVVDDNTYRNNPVVARLPFGDYYVVVEDYSITPKQRIVLKNIKIDGKKEILKSIDFEEGKLKILTLKNDSPIPAKYEIFLPRFSKKIKSGFTNPNTGEALIKLAAGNYDVRIIHRGSVSKTVKKFKDISVEKDNVKELDVLFREGKLRVISKRGLNPLYTNVSIYKPGSTERLYFDFTSRENGEVVIDLPAGVYDVVVSDHNIKRVFKRVRIREKKTYTIHAKF